MPKLPRLTPQEAEGMLQKAGFKLVRSKGSHRIYMKENARVVIPFHKGKVLHPKIVKQVVKVISQED
ncbi:MAG: type II toxin-antitoxin system HicA family toxin [Deltaproteobacteria bacterium]